MEEGEGVSAEDYCSKNSSPGLIPITATLV